MPIYEYVCLNEDCKKTNEVIQRIGTPAPKSCEYCETGKLVKKTSLPSFHLKGGGWYKDGYSAEKPKETPSSTPAPKKDVVEKSNPDGNKPTKKPVEAPAPT